VNVRNQPVVVAALGQWGPFDDGRTIKYVDLVDGDGGGIFRASYAEGYDGAGLGPMLTGTADLEFHVRDGKTKCRVHGFKAQVSAKAA
jgi:hypothetical protein